MTPNDFYRRFLNRPHANARAGWAESTITAASFELSAELEAMILAAELCDREISDPTLKPVNGRVVGWIGAVGIIGMKRRA